MLDGLHRFALRLSSLSWYLHPLDHPEGHPCVVSSIEYFPFGQCTWRLIGGSACQVMVYNVTSLTTIIIQPKHNTIIIATTLHNYWHAEICIIFNGILTSTGPSSFVCWIVDQSLLHVDFFPPDYSQTSFIPKAIIQSYWNGYYLHMKRQRNLLGSNINKLHLSSKTCVLVDSLV